MIHYHGTPITPRAELLQLAGRSFCVSFARPDDVTVCHEIGEGVMLDNGAFSFWRTGKAVDWQRYYDFCERWLVHRTTWAVIPDVIDGDLEDNHRLIVQWFTQSHRWRRDAGAPVWHMHEPIDHLRRLVGGYQRVCFGSSGQYATVGNDAWRRRCDEAFNAIHREGRVDCWIHMLRGLALAGSEYPFASADSTNVARNHNRPQNTALKLATRIDAQQCAPVWVPRFHTEELAA